MMIEIFVGPVLVGGEEVEIEMGEYEVSEEE